MEVAMALYEIEDAFTSNVAPECTYIDRKINKYETYSVRLKKALQVNNKIVFISGAYRSGKTTLYKHAISKSKLIVLDSRKIFNEYSFWLQLKEVLGTMPKSNYFEIYNEQEKCIKNLILQYLIKTQKILIIDDFHNINSRMQLNIISVLKEVIPLGLKAVIISVSSKLENPISILENNLIQIFIEPWRTKDLKEIARKGFAALKIKASEECIEKITKESIACPRLIHEICHKLAIFCKFNDIQQLTMEHVDYVLYSCVFENDS